MVDDTDFKLPIKLYLVHIVRVSFLNYFQLFLNGNLKKTHFSIINKYDGENIVYSF